MRKMKEMRKTSNLDERQEQKLLEIESRGCWLAFWGLLAAMVVQLIAYGFDISKMAGEWIIFMILALYIASACLENGIWDRRLKANTKTNLIASLIAAVGLGMVNFLAIWGRYPQKPMGALVSGVISAVSAFVLCFAVMLVFTRAYKKRQRELEQESEDEDDL